MSFNNEVSISFSAYSITSSVLSTDAEHSRYHGISSSEIVIYHMATENVIEVYVNVNWTVSSVTI